VSRAIAEDLGSGDLTAELIGRHTAAAAHVVAREPATLCGRAWFDETFRQLDPRVRVAWRSEDGAAIASDSIVCELRGPARSIVTGERTALNFLQTLSGTATATRSLVDIVTGTHTRILDTRKTLPGLRLAQKYAVRCGGGSNHRVGLHDAILIKENHIAAAGSIAAAVSAARALHPRLMVEVEVENFTELDEAIAARADRIMLDEFSLADMRRAVERVAGRVALEASGGVQEDGLRAIAQTGVDFISIGALTKHVRAIDLSMRIKTRADIA